MASRAGMTGPRPKAHLACDASLGRPSVKMVMELLAPSLAAEGGRCIEIREGMSARDADVLRSCVCPGSASKFGVLRAAQFFGGDILCVYSDFAFFVEVKAERRFTENLFIELSSDASRSRDGWAVRRRARGFVPSVLVYRFVGRKECYVMSMDALSAFLHAHIDFSAPHGKRVLRCPGHVLRELDQRAHVQENRTTGICAPIKSLKGFLGSAFHAVVDVDMALLHCTGVLGAANVKRDCEVLRRRK